jgi:hypothetical protein
MVRRHALLDPTAVPYCAPLFRNRCFLIRSYRGNRFSPGPCPGSRYFSLGGSGRRPGPDCPQQQLAPGSTRCRSNEPVVEGNFLGSLRRRHCTQQPRVALRTLGRRRTPAHPLRRRRCTSAAPAFVQRLRRGPLVPSDPAQDPLCDPGLLRVTASRQRNPALSPEQQVP